MFDVLDDASGTHPLLVHPFKVEPTLFGNPWALPSAPPTKYTTRAMDQQDLRNLLESSEAVPIGSLKAEMTLEGNISDSVIVEDVSARIESRSSAPRGTFISAPSAGGGNPKIILGFDLDAADKRARITRPDGSLGELFGEKEYFEIRRGEKFVFTFQAVTKTPFMYRWVVDLTLQFGGKHATLTLGKDSPYLITGPVSQYENYYHRTNWQIKPTTAEQACPGGCAAWADKWARAHG